MGRQGGNVMKNKMKSRGSGATSGRPSGSGKGNPTMNRAQPGGGRISRGEQQRASARGEGQMRRQSDTEADAGEPSNQTSTAQDQSGEL
jgi:hypothetical protein